MATRKVTRREFLGTAAIVSGGLPAVLGLALPAPAAAGSGGYAPPKSQRATFSFNLDWKFFRDDVAGAEDPLFDDSAWATISTPHTFNDIDSFRKIIAHSGGDVGTYKGLAWYRKHFKLPADLVGRKIFVEFEGMRQAGDIFLNGKRIGLYENGITAYGLDISGAVQFGDHENVLAVKVDNRTTYPERATNIAFEWNANDFNPDFGGINRHVWLHVTGIIYQTLPLYYGLEGAGVYAHATNFDISRKSADVTIESEVRNDGSHEASVELAAVLVGQDGRVHARFAGDSAVIAAGTKSVLTAKVTLKRARLWSPDDPYLYDAYTILKVDGNVVDIAKTVTGFRKTEFKGGVGTGGVHLNDKFIYLKGFAQRASNEWEGPGQAYPDWMHDYTAQMIRDCHANYVRWMHISPQRVDADSFARHGIIQICPAGDKERDVTGRQWDQRVEVMRASMIYFRNNPSILFWEAGNTIVTVDQMQEMVALRKKWDPFGGRVIGVRDNDDTPANIALTPYSEYYGIMIGQAPQTDALAKPSAMFRGYSAERRDRAPLVEAEDFREEGARRFWDDYSPPYFGFKKGPNDTWQFTSESFALAGIKRYWAYWQNRISNTDPAHSKWSGYASIYFSDSDADGRQDSSEVARVSGKVDAVRLPKEIYFAHRVIQNEQPDIHILGHWSYPSGADAKPTVKTIYVIANTESVELFVNGKSLGVNSRPDDGFIFAFPGVTFAGNIIPANTINPCTGLNYIDPNGLSTLKFLPSPNAAGSTGGNVYNYSYQLSNAYPRSETTLRGDYQITDSARLSVSWVHNHDDQQFHLGTTTESWNWPLDNVDRFNGPGNIESVTLTTNFGPTWVNEFTGGSARGQVSIVPQGNGATRATTGVTTPFLYPSADTANLIPSLAFGGIANVPTTPSTAVTGLFYQHFNIWQLMDNLTKVHGSHILKFGFYFESSANQSSSQTNTESNINFGSGGGNPLDSGYSFANALLGVFQTYSQASQQVKQNFLYHDVSWYAQDTWKVKSNLTLDLGVRFSYWLPTYDKGAMQGFFNPSNYVAGMAPQLYYPVCIGDGTVGFTGTCTSGSSNYRALPSSSDPTQAQEAAATMANTMPAYDVGREVPGTGSLTNGLITTPAAGYPVAGFNVPSIIVQPRLGFAWDVGGRHGTVMRGGFGISPDRYETLSCGATDSPIVVSPTLNSGYLSGITSGGGALGIPNVCGFGKNEKFPQVYSYSLGVQKSIGRGTVLDVAYVGNQSRHLLRESDLNSVPYGTLFTAAAQDPTQYPGGLIPANEGLCSICSYYPEYAAAGAAFMADRVLPSATGDYNRPYLGYSTIQWYTFDGNANYNSLQLELSRQFLKGLTFTAAYTLSRTYTTVSSDGTYTNYLSPQRFDYGPATFDRANQFIASFVWNMPGLAHFMGDGLVARGFFDNWILSGVSSVASGLPTELSVSISGVDATARILGTPTGNGGQNVRLFLSGKPQYGSANNSLVPSAFVVPQISQVGPYPRFYYRQPGFYNQDFSIFKDFPFNESHSRYLQLRLEAFNVLNHPEYNGFNNTTNITNVAGATGASIFANYTGLTITNNLRGSNTSKVLGNYFGEYSGANSQRVLQIAAKFYF